MEEMMQIIRELDWSPLFISLKTGVVATIISFFLGIFAARKVVKASPGKKAVIDGILTLPMVLPPTVAGFFLLLLFSRRRPLGEFLFDHTLKVRTKPPEKPIVFPKGLEYIGEQAFGKSEYSLSVVVLPESLKTVGKLPFGNICPSRLICLCDTTAWSKDWCTYVEKSLYSKENELRSYTYLDVPNNIFQYKFSVTSNDIERLKKELQSYKGFADFDENKTKFVGPKPTKGTPDSSNAQKKKGCYIATAVYGSYDCPQVWTLRRYRDFTLSRSAFGRLFIKFYYALSPTLVKLFGKQKWFRAIWKRILDKKVRRLNEKGIEDIPYCDR